MPAVARELSIVYGGVTVGGTSSSFLLHNPYKIDSDYEKTSVECLCMVVGTSEADFAAQIATLEAAWRKINQDTTITLGAQTIESLSHGSNTGFLARPSFRKLGGDEDTGRSRLYELRLTVFRPADLTGKNGLREAGFELLTAATGERSYRVTGSYTAIGGNGATAQYTAQIGGLLTTFETALTGTWERLAAQYTRDDEDKVLRFTATGLELFFSQAQGVLDHAAIKNQTLLVDVSAPAPGDAIGATRPAIVTISYAAEIDKSQTIDLAGFWKSTVKPWLLQHAQNVANASAVALVRSAPRFDYPHNRISATAEISAVTGTSLLQRRVRTRDDKDEGKLIWDVWDGTDYGAELFPGKKRWIRTVTEDLVRLTASSAGDAAGGNALGAGNRLGQAPAPVANAQQGQQPPAGFELIRTITDGDPIVIGLTELNYSVSIESTVKIYRYVTKPAAAGGSRPSSNRIESGLGKNGVPLL